MQLQVVINPNFHFSLKLAFFQQFSQNELFKLKNIKFKISWSEQLQPAWACPINTHRTFLVKKHLCYEIDVNESGKGIVLYCAIFFWNGSSVKLPNVVENVHGKMFLVQSFL